MTKVYDIKPTEKQKEAFRILLENGCTEKEAMIKAGYSPNTAISPKKLRQTKGWQQLLEEYLPDEDLTKKHKEFLNSKKEEIGLKALDLGYKVKGKLVERIEYSGRKSTTKLQDEELNRLMDVFGDKEIAIKE